MEDEIYYTIYKVTNKTNGKVYIGSHKTKNLDDGYMGSGKYLRRAMEKSGVDNFTKEILHIFKTAKEMYDKEAEIVNEDFLATENTYNLKVGGYGGFDYINSNDNFLTSKRLSNLWTNKERSKRWKEKWDNDSTFRELNKQRLLKAAEVSRERFPKGTFFGKTHTEETKKKIGNVTRELTGEKNSQHNTMWIHNLELKISKKISKSEPIPNNWIVGRKMKW